LVKGRNRTRFVRRFITSPTVADEPMRVIA